MAESMGQVDETDVQPGVLSDAELASAYVYGRDVFGRLEGATAADLRDSLGTLCAWAFALPPARTVTIGVTASGLRRLGVARGLIGMLPAPFVLGASARADLLGDPSPEAWEHGTGGTGTKAHDVVVMVSSTSPLPAGPLVPCLADGHQPLDTFLNADRREAFGFVDGISNPVLRGIPGSEAQAMGNGVRTATGWRPLAAGEIILGYVNEAGELPGAPVSHDLTRNGTFLVWRKLEQHRAAFDALVASICAQRASEGHVTVPSEVQPGSCEECAALVIGRQRNGCPISSAAVGYNGFDYQEPVTDARQAPVNSHIRRANPRRTDHFDDVTVNRHRILRRSARWQSVRRDGTGEREGLVFRCYQADIAAGFEFVQRSWLNTGDAFRQGRTRDPLVAGILGDTGTPDPFAFEQTRFSWGDGQVVPHTAPLTSVRGSLYALVPGKRALDLLAAGRWKEPELP